MQMQFLKRAIRLRSEDHFTLKPTKQSLDLDNAAKILENHDVELTDYFKGLEGDTIYINDLYVRGQNVSLDVVLERLKVSFQYLFNQTGLAASGTVYFHSNQEQGFLFNTVDGHVSVRFGSNS